MIKKIKVKYVNDLLEIEMNNFKKYWGKPILKDVLQNKNYYVYGEMKEEKLISYVIYKDSYDILELCRIAVLKPYKNKGYASRIIKYSEEKLEKKDIILEVSEKNYIGIKFYEKNNYKKISCRKNYYGNNESAFIYRKNRGQ